MGVDESATTYHRLREQAYEDPVATKNEFLKILADNQALAVAVLTAATDQRGARFRQITARALGKKPLPPDIEKVFNTWIPDETDEFALAAIREAISSSQRGGTPKPRKPLQLAQPLELEGTYKYVAGRLRHRVLNALPGVGMTIQRLKVDVQKSGSPALAASLSPQLDQLYGQLSKLEAAVKFDEDSTYFQSGPVELMSWLRDHQAKFASEYAPIVLALDFDVNGNAIHIQATPYWLETTFTNLWKNSVDAVGGAGCHITLKGTIMGNDLHITVIDNGEGFQANDVERAFHFQYSSKSKERGRGHMEVRDAMERMSGSACVSATDQGYRVQLVFRSVAK